MSNPPFSSKLTRRQAIQKTVLFSTSLLMARWLPGAEVTEPTTRFSDPGLNLLALGDFGWAREAHQCRVAEQMARFTRQLDQPVDAVLALGDNFYGKMTPNRFERDFELMYDAEALPCPFYACIGNHDYERVSYGLNPEPAKYQAQLEYAASHPDSRWKMPAKWYSVELAHSGKPLLKVIVLDSNIQEGALTPQEKLKQKRFLDAELAKETEAPWLWFVWHHPLFTETTKRRDNPRLLRIVDEALSAAQPAFCLAGHDHNLQHLQVNGYSTSFIVSGAGGAPTYDVTPSSRGFSEKNFGFNHFHVTPSHIDAQFLSAAGKCLHAFRRHLDGRVEILS